jgi:putative phosphoesterase
MTRIGLLSDTHGWLDDAVLEHFASCDEIWHAGDFGSTEVVDRLKAFAEASERTIIVRGVWGNIDGYELRSQFPQHLAWRCEDVAVYITHIGGYPNKYAPGVKKELVANASKLFICGHSHILKIIYDSSIDCLHMNPGAAGKQGWHKVRTLIRFVIDEKNMRDCEVIELGKRG